METNFSKQDKENKEQNKFSKINSQIQQELDEKEARREMKERNRRTDNLLCLIFTILFLVIIIMQFDISARYKVKTSLRTFFGFDKINSKIFNNKDLQTNFLFILNLADQGYSFFPVYQ